MPNLSLFGVALPLAGAANPNLPLGATATASITLDAAAQRITIGVTGVVAGVDLTLSWTGAYAAGAQLRLLDAPAPTVALQGRLQLETDWVALVGAGLQVSIDADIGLEIVDPQGTAFGWLQQHLPAGFQVDLSNSDTRIVFNLRPTPARAIHRPAGGGGPRVRLADNFQHDMGFPGGSFTAVQALDVDALTVAGSDITLTGTPEAGALFLHADVLDTSTTSDQDSPFLFQYALTNGQLRFERRAGVGGTTWVSAGGLSSLLLLRHQDEHGHPLVFLPAGPVPLTTRTGVGQSVKASTDPAEWNYTNPATVIGPSDPSGPLVLAGALGRLDASKLYAAFADPSRNKNSFSDPWFVLAGAVPVEAAAPSEIIGLSRGARLVANAPDRTAKLVVTPEVVGGAAVFHHTELQLGDAGNWTVRTLRAERDLKPSVDTVQPRPVGAYTQTGKPHSGAVALPAIDVAYAAANLAGEARINNVGMRLGTGALLAAAQAKLEALESQMLGRFELPFLPEQRHVDGAGIDAAQRQAFVRQFDDLPTRAASAAEVARVAPELKGQDAQSPVPPPAMVVLSARSAALSPLVSRLVFGGGGGPVGPLADTLAGKANAALGSSGAAFRFFEVAWRDLASDARVAALRAKLAIEPRPTELLDPERAADLLDAAIDYVASSDNISDITGDQEALQAYLDRSSADDFADDWKTPTPGLLRLFEHVWCPANLDLMRRIARLVADPKQTFADLAARLFGVADLTAVLAALDAPAGGLLQALIQGSDGLWQAAQDIWKEGVEARLVALRAKYGPLLTLDVYRRLLADDASHDAQALVGVLDDFLDVALRNLADLPTEPPDYVFRTKRFQVQQASREPLVEALWNQCFNLCAFADKAWNLFLDDDASIVVKLSRKRPLDELLREIAASYRTPDRPDPLGVGADRQSGDPPIDPIVSLDAFIGDLDAEIRDPEWVGVLFIRPVADIHGDVVLRDLAGFDHITAYWAAVGGRVPTVSVSDPPSIDVWAHILKEQQTGPDLPLDPAPVMDVKLALTKFDVRIRQTQLSDANIEVMIEPQDVWGQNKTAFKTIVLHGAMQSPAGDPSAPKDLVFTAFFPQPLILDIDLAFVHQAELRSLRVTRRQGATGIDIDGVLTLVNNTTGLDLSLDMDGDKLELALQDFRYLLPPLPGVKVQVGTRRKLAFDYPAASFALPKPRAFNLFGVELIPTGLGYIRASETAVLDQFADRYIWLSRLNISGHPQNIFVPYLEFDVDFGKNPSFGLVDARGLRFRMALALQVVNAAPRQAYLGISGLDAKDLTLDIFGFLKLQMKSLRISPAKLLQGTEPEGPHPVDAGAILAERISLHILGWSPLPEDSELDLLMLHPTRMAAGGDPTRKGLLAYYANPNPTSFFKVWWLVVAHNLQLPTGALNYLLDEGPGAQDPSGFLGHLFEAPQEDPDPNRPRQNLLLRNVSLLDRESWLFGMCFGLDGLFDRCSFVLHDQHYYGIHLWAEWVKLVFGQDSLELAYIPGPTRPQDRFRTNLRVPALDFLGSLKSGEVALEWAVNWDFLVDVGFPWRTSVGYDWFRSFSIPVGCYEAKFGFYVEKSTSVIQSADLIELGAGLGFYLGYYFGAGNSIAWVRAGIGVFAIVQGSITFRKPQSADPLAILRSSIYEIEITGVIGVMAYGEGGVDVWILSARFRVSAQAAVACTIRYISSGPCVVSYTAMLAASYSASVRVGCGFCSWTFSVAGEVGMSVSGQVLLS